MEDIMLKFALYTLLTLAVLAAVVVAYASTRPDTFRVARSVSISAPPEAIFPLINDLRKFSTWSPFDKKDPNMARVYSGPDSGKGQRLDWDGNNDIGKGWFAIVDTSPPSKVDMELNMLKPMKAGNHVTFTLAPEGNGTNAGSTNVTWAMQGDVPLFAKVLHLFVDMEKMCGDDFATGLSSLKAMAEGRAVSPSHS
jgi:hypothetical protein